MKIAYLITGLGLGGAETQLSLVANYLSQKYKYKIIILYLTGPQVINLNNDLIQVYSLNIRKNPIYLIKSLIKAYRILKTFSPDVLHCHMFHANIFGRFIKIFMNLPKIICTAHSFNEGGWLRMQTYKVTDFLCNTTTHVCKEAASFFIQKKYFKAHKTKIVHNAVNCSEFIYSEQFRKKIKKDLNLSQDIKIILNVGRLVEQKDQKMLLKSIQLLKKECNIKFKLLIAGDGHLKNNLSKLIQQSNIENEVLLLGSVKNIQEIYSAADLFVLSSAIEGFPVALVEAMSSSLPCISTNCSGASEIFEETDNVIVQIGDAHKLKDEIINFFTLNIKNVENKKMISREKVINNYSIDKIASEWIDIYKN